MVLVDGQSGFAALASGGEQGLLHSFALLRLTASHHGCPGPVQTGKAGMTRKVAHHARAGVIRALIRRTQHDFLSYFEGTSFSERAAQIVMLAVSGYPGLASLRDELTSLVPDTETDGSWECSYALNAGAIMLSLIDYQIDGDEGHYEEAVTLFFDTIDFKVQQDLEREGIFYPTQEQISSHEYFVREKSWFFKLTF
ncbi:hypothetical protein D3C78_681210 [compost metagenome]